MLCVRDSGWVGFGGVDYVVDVRACAAEKLVELFDDCFGAVDHDKIGYQTEGSKKIEERRDLEESELHDEDDPTWSGCRAI